MGKFDLNYRVASLADLARLKNLGIIAYGQFKTVLSPDNWEKLKIGLNDEQKLRELINTSTCFVCLDGDKIVGMAHLIPHGHPWDIFKAEWAYIRMVGVDPAYSGRGIAKQLTKRCIDFAKQNDETTLALHTSEFMDAARHIYEGLGFKVLKEIDPRFGKKYWLYTLDLK